MEDYNGSYQSTPNLASIFRVKSFWGKVFNTLDTDLLMTGNFNQEHNSHKKNWNANTVSGGSKHGKEYITPKI